MQQAPVSLGQGFPDPVKDAQRVFRAVMDATARPGLVQTVHVDLEAPAGIMPATSALALTLFDHDTPIWCDDALRGGNVDAWLRFHTGAPIVDDASVSSFALIGNPVGLAGFDAFSLGTSDYPDRSTTLIIQLETLTAGHPLVLSGPGIRDSAHIAPSSLPAGCLDWLAINQASFPRGIDLVLAAGHDIVALPRTTVVKALEA